MKTKREATTQPSMPIPKRYPKNQTQPDPPNPRTSEPPFFPRLPTRDGGGLDQPKATASLAYSFTNRGQGRRGPSSLPPTPPNPSTLFSVTAPLDKRTKRRPHSFFCGKLGYQFPSTCGSQPHRHPRRRNPGPDGALATPLRTPSQPQPARPGLHDQRPLYTGPGLTPSRQNPYPHPRRLKASDARTPCIQMPSIAHPHQGGQRSLPTTFSPLPP